MYIFTNRHHENAMCNKQYDVDCCCAYCHTYKKGQGDRHFLINKVSFSFTSSLIPLFTHLISNRKLCVIDNAAHITIHDKRTGERKWNLVLCERHRMGFCCCTPNKWCFVSLPHLGSFQWGWARFQAVSRRQWLRSACFADWSCISDSDQQMSSSGAEVDQTIQLKTDFLSLSLYSTTLFLSFSIFIIL